jgi:hypothetical protein
MCKYARLRKRVVNPFFAVVGRWNQPQGPALDHHRSLLKISGPVVAVVAGYPEQFDELPALQLPAVAPIRRRDKQCTVTETTSPRLRFSRRKSGDEGG